MLHFNSCRDGLGAVTACLLLLMVAGFASAAEKEQFTPSWMKIDAAAKSVELNIVAGFNVNNNNWNFNGYYNGNLTLVVPENWKVKIDFTTIDGNYPHSLVVIDAPASGEKMPVQAGREEVAIRRAYSKNPLGGIYSGEKDTVTFKVKESRDYLLFCGVPGHGLGGMWAYFKVSAEAKAPYIVVAEGADEGRT